MATHERIEAEPKEPFNRADCVRHTARTFSPFLFPLGEYIDIESRYLGDDVYVRPGEPFKSFYSLHVFFAQKMSQFSDPGVELTNKRLQEFHDQHNRSRRGFGPTVVARARKFRLVETLTPEEAKARLARDINLTEEVNQQRGPFNSDGWCVFPTKGSDNPILLVPTKSKEGQIYFETVSLDDLHAQDPKFLPQQIRDYEKKYAMDALANSVSYNLNLHKLPEAKLLPEYMKEIAQIADPEQRAREIQSMQTFMSWMVRLGADYANTVYNFNQGLSSRQTDVGDGRSAYIQSYLGHMAECPTQTEETHQRSVVLTGAYNALLSVHYNAPSFDRQAENPVIQVLQEPARHTVYLDRDEERSNADREQDQKVIDFITETGGVTDQTQLLEALQQALPDFHATLVRFQEWLGTDYFEKSQFDRFIARTAGRISLADVNFDLKKLNEALRQELIVSAWSAKGKFEGVHADNRRIREGADIYNPHLEAVLPLMAIKSKAAEIEERAQKAAKEGDMLMDNIYKRQAQHLQGLTEELVQSYREKIKRIDEVLEDIAEGRASVASLKEQTGITDEEIARLIELATLEDGKDDGGFSPRIDSHLYTGLFNALVLEKRGMVDMHSPAFKGLLKSLFPGKPDTVWQNL